MKITVSQLRRIIKEEISRTLLREGVLDDSLTPKENIVGSDTKQNAWFASFLNILEGKLEEAILPQVGKEVGAYMEITVHPPRDNRSEIAVTLRDEEFIKAVRSYVKTGYKGTNEFIDALVDELNSSQAAGANARKVLDDSVQEMLNNIQTTSMKKAFEDLGFTEGSATFENGGEKFAIRIHPVTFTGGLKLEIELGRPLSR